MTIATEVARVDAIIAAGHPTYDDDGNERVETETCGQCGRSWNVARISELTPPPSGRCPYEYAHVEEPETTTEARPELSYDGKGINGPDEYRSRIATFQNDEAARRYGPLFAGAPALVEALGEIAAHEIPKNEAGKRRQSLETRVLQALAYVKEVAAAALAEMDGTP